MSWRAPKYETTAQVSVRCAAQTITVTVTRDRVAVTAPATENHDHEIVEARAKATIGAITRARRIYRRTFGRRAP